MCYDKDYIYFLTSQTGSIVKFNTVTEEYTSTQALTSGICNSIVKYGDDIYGFEGLDAKNFYNKSVLYVKDRQFLVQESFDRKLKVTHLSSKTEIRDFVVDEDYNYYVLHGKNKLSKFAKERILTYTTEIKSSSTNLFYTEYAISPLSQISLIKMDFVREYTSDGLKKYPIILGMHEIADGPDNPLFLMKLDENGLSASKVTFLDLSGNFYSYGSPQRNNYNLTNYEFLKNTYPDADYVYFKIKLENVYDNEDVIDVEIPISTKGFSAEKHHFAFKLDGINGYISVYLDGDLVKSVKISSGQYIFQDLFTESFNIGNTYFHNAISLDDYLKQPNYYYANNGNITDFKVYKKALTDNEILFHVYAGSKMNDLIVTLPSDQRSEIDTIERLFKLDTNGNKSNSINIFIKNSQITNTNLQSQLKEILLDRMSKVLPATTKINNIEFR